MATARHLDDDDDATFQNGMKDDHAFHYLAPRSVANAGSSTTLNTDWHPLSSKLSNLSVTDIEGDEPESRLERQAMPSKSRTSPSPRPFWRSVIPESIPCRLYILVIVIQTLVDLAIEGVLVLKFHQAATNSPDLSTRRLPIYFSIFGFAHVFQFVLAVDAVWMRNTLQFLFLTAFNFIILIYAVVQIFEIRDIPQSAFGNTNGVVKVRIDVLTALTPCVTAVAELAYLVLGWSIWREFGWKVYKLLGADRRVKRMYMHYQILQCIMKFDVFFWGGFSIQLIWMVLQRTNVEYYVTVAALPASLVVLLAGHLGTRYEHRPLMYAFMASCVGASAYFAFKLFRIIQQRNEPNIQPVFKTLAAFAALALLFLVATFTWSCIVLSNFGAGLKRHMSKHKQPSTLLLRRKGTSPLEEDIPQFEMSVNAKRMSID